MSDTNESKLIIIPTQDTTRLHRHTQLSNSQPGYSEGLILLVQIAVRQPAEAVFV